MDDSLPPTTTVQQDIVTTRQSRINIIWEATQAIIAISITLAIIFCAIVGRASQELTNAFFLIVGFYFSRTNHAAIGGIGIKPIQSYEGR